MNRSQTPSEAPEEEHSPTPSLTDGSTHEDNDSVPQNPHNGNPATPPEVLSAESQESLPTPPPTESEDNAADGTGSETSDTQTYIGDVVEFPPDTSNSTSDSEETRDSADNTDDEDGEVEGHGNPLTEENIRRVRDGAPSPQPSPQLARNPVPASQSNELDSENVPQSSRGDSSEEESQRG